MIQDASTSHCKMVHEVTKKLYSDKIWSDTNVPLVVKAFFLCFYDTININAPNVSAMNILQTLWRNTTKPLQQLWDSGFLACPGVRVSKSDCVEGTLQLVQVNDCQ
ncbi:hypothetical protein BDL97_11G100900 [Sphagnum fallax]|jgi:hypothetical protein|nr:hypothetical protein BDL97_11G100900 [Sphagnum fallax]KAH8948566.1 hypothetical protein BDL97_11G100900 [Sphagnum fallax]